MIIKEKIVEEIQNGETSLGIEFGSTRIKAVLVGNDFSRWLVVALTGRQAWKMDLDLFTRRNLEWVTILLSKTFG